MKEQQLFSQENIIKKDMNNIILIKPGGNDTALVPGTDIPQDLKTLINNTIMDKFPNIEQVGFIDLSNKALPVLQMAGGEFCGNATRSTAFLALDGKPGQVKIAVSGVDRLLNAGVDENNNAWAEMPVPDSIQLKTEGDYTLVPLDGITQVIVQKPENLNSPEEIKSAGVEILKKLNLINNPDVPASGVMFISQENDQIISKPVVWVRDIKTCFFETACGSGTAAVGLYQAIISGQKQINISIMQPSGMSINALVDLTKDRPQVIISGPVTVLEKDASIEIQKPIKISQVADQEGLQQAFNNGLIELYKEIFIQPPYNEVFETNEVEEIFKDYLNQNGLIFVAKDQNQVVGFGAAVPIMQSSIKEVAETNNLPENSWYMADLGVKESIRRQDLGTKLIQARLDQIPSGSLVIMRTARKNLKSQNLYKKLGFEEFPFTQSVSQERSQGNKTDERIFLGKTI